MIIPTAHNRRLMIQIHVNPLITRQETQPFTSSLLPVTPDIRVVDFRGSTIIVMQRESETEREGRNESV